MPQDQNSNDGNDFQYDKELLEGEESSFAEHRASLQQTRILREWEQDQEYSRKERRDNWRWVIGIAITTFGVAISITAIIIFISTNRTNHLIELQSELRDVRDRLTVLETIHSQEHFGPNHCHATEPLRESANDAGALIP